MVTEPGWAAAKLKSPEPVVEVEAMNLPLKGGCKPRPKKSWPRLKRLQSSAEAEAEEASRLKSQLQPPKRSRKQPLTYLKKRKLLSRKASRRRPKAQRRM
jgi:hypothetical protein